MKIFAQWLRLYCDYGNLPKALRITIDTVIGKPLEILNKNFELMDIEVEENKIE